MHINACMRIAYSMAHTHAHMCTFIDTNNENAVMKCLLASGRLKCYHKIQLQSSMPFAFSFKFPSMIKRFALPSPPISFPPTFSALFFFSFFRLIHCHLFKLLLTCCTRYKIFKENHPMHFPFAAFGNTVKW